MLFTKFQSSLRKPSCPTVKSVAVKAATTALCLLALSAATWRPAHAAQAPTAAQAKKALAATARKPYSFRHSSIWAARWATAHPAQEAAYQAKLYQRWMAQHHRPVVRAARAARPRVALRRVALRAKPALAPALPDAASVRPLAVVAATARPSQAARPTQGEASQARAAVTNLRSSDNVTLDFVAADINDVLKALAVQTGANIVSSTDVKGTVTVSLANVSLEQALDMVARLSGYEYAKVGNTYVVGTPSGIQALTGSSGNAQQVTTVVTFTYANPTDITTALKQRFPNMNVSTGTAISGSNAGAGTKALLLSGDPTLVSQAKDLVMQIDASLGANVASESTVAYHVKYASLSDLISILNSLVPNLVVTPGPSQGFMAKAPSAAASAASSSTSTAGTSGSSSSGSSGATGSSQASATGPNILLLTGSDTDVARAQQILGQVDVQPKQLLFETKVVETDIDGERKLGLTYDFSGAHTSIGEDLPAGTTSVPTIEPDPYPGQILKGRTFGRTYITNLVNIQLQAVETNANTKILADPDIEAIDGQPAQVFVGDNINYVSAISTNSSTATENVTTASVQVGVIMRVTGKVDGDGYITLNIHPEVSSIKDFLQVPGGGELPDVTTRYADTTVRVKDGDTLAIGGLIQHEDIENIQKVPILGDLPFFGQLFRYNDHSKNNDEIIFFLRTSIVKDS